MTLDCPHCSQAISLDESDPQVLSPAGFHCAHCGGHIVIDTPAPSLHDEPTQRLPVTPVPMRECPQCGSTIPPGTPSGQCPLCLLRGVSSDSIVEEDLIAVTQTFDERYRIDRLVGRGGMGSVYEAWDVRLSRRVAIKVLPEDLAGDSDAARRFEREARAMAALQHPNIVHIHDFGSTSDGSRYLVMEFVDGMNIHQLRQSGQLTLQGTLQIIAQVCAALQYAHSRGIVHRDIKPANILVARDGQVKVADFGLARMIGTASRPQADPTLTKSGTVMGTPDYMAPEALAGAKVDHRADIYALGVMLYDLLTGTPPRGTWAPPSDVVEVDERIDEIVLRALRQNPQDRYQSAAEVQSDVETVITTTHGEPVPAGEVVQPLPSSGSHSPAAVAPARRLTTPPPAQPAMTSSAEFEAAEEMLATTRSLSNTLLFLGLLAIAIFGGLALFLAQRKGGETKIVNQSITTTETRNSYFSQIILSGAATEADMAAIEDIMPHGAGFVGLSKEALSPQNAASLAKRVGAAVMAIDELPSAELQSLASWAGSTVKSATSTAFWVRRKDASVALSADARISESAVDVTRKALLYWQPAFGNATLTSTATTTTASSTPSSSTPPLADTAAPAPQGAMPSPASALQAGVPHEWKDATGRVIQASFVKLDGDNITLLMNGTRYDLPLSRLSPESIRLARELATSSTQPPR